MPEVTIDDAPRMNVLGLFLAAALEKNLVERGRACPLEGALTVDADGMRATVVFGASGAVVTRDADGARATIAGPLALLTKALVRPSLGTLLRVRVRGSRLFALRARRYFAP